MDIKKPTEIRKHIEAEVEMVVPDWGKYAWIQINMNEPYSILYFIDGKCPTDKHNKIEKTILEQVELIGITAEFHD
jgi:hypothetical protein